MATDYGKRLKKARKDAGLTQAELCKKTGIAQSTISTAEREGQGSNDVLYALATGVDPLWLSTGNESETAVKPSNVVTIERRQCTPTEVFDNLEAMLMQLDDSLRDGVAGALYGMAKDPSKPGNRAMLEAAFAPQTFAGENRRHK